MRVAGGFRLAAVLVPQQHLLVAIAALHPLEPVATHLQAAQLAGAEGIGLVLEGAEDHGLAALGGHHDDPGEDDTEGVECRRKIRKKLRAEAAAYGKKDG